MIRFIYSRDRGVFPNIRAFRDEVRKAMVSEVGPRAIELASSQIPHWKTPRTFIVSTRVGIRGITADVAPTEDWADYWWYASDGVKGHFIRPRARGLRVPNPKGYKYTPSLKFTPGKVGLLGSYSYEAYSKGHWWPGIVPRHFGTKIRVPLGRDFLGIMRKAVKRGITRAQREGT